MLFVGGVAFSVQSLWIVGLMVLVFVALYFFGMRTRMGKKMTATATDPRAARMSGISANRMIILAFSISPPSSAISGAWPCRRSYRCRTRREASLASTASWAPSSEDGAPAGGAALGGLALGVIQSLASGVLPAGYQDAIAFGLLILILYFRPQGLLGTTIAEGEF